MFVQQHVDHGEQEGGVGLRLDRDPLGRAGAGHREVRLDLHALHAAVARIGMALDPAYPARGLDIGAEREDIVAERSVGAHGEGAVPEFAVEVFRMGAFNTLTRAETQIDRPPSRQKSRQRAHIGGRSATSAEARGQSRKTTLVEQNLRARGFQFLGDQIERLVPGDAHEARIFVAALLRVGPLHRVKDAVRAVGFLHQPERLDAGLAAAGMDRGGFEIRIDLGRHPVLDAHGQQVRPRYALVAIGRDDAFLRWLAFRHNVILSPSGGTCLVARACWRPITLGQARYQRSLQRYCRQPLARAPRSPP